MNEETKTISRRKLRMRLGSRVIRRANTKTPKIDGGKRRIIARPRVQLERLIKQYEAEGYTVL